MKKGRMCVCACMYVSRIAIMGWDSCHRVQVASPSSSSFFHPSAGVCVCSRLEAALLL